MQAEELAHHRTRIWELIERKRAAAKPPRKKQKQPDLMVQVCGRGRFET